MVAPGPTLLGWRFEDPGPAPLPPSLNRVPVGTDPAALAQAHAAWQRQVISEMARLQQQHQQCLLHHRVEAESATVSVFGGTAVDHRKLVRTLVAGLGKAGFERIRIADLSGDAVDELLEDPNLRYATRRDVVSSQGSTFDVFGVVPPADLPGLVSDVLRDDGARQGQRSSQRRQLVIREVADLLGPPIRIERLSAAVRAATTGAPDPSLSATEQAALADYRANVVSRNRQTSDLLDGLRFDLDGLVAYGPAPTRQPEHFGSQIPSARTKPLVRVLRASGAGAVSDQETERDLLGHIIARALGSPGAHRSATIVAGADRLAQETVRSILDAAAKQRTPLVLLFESCEGAAQQAVRSRANDTFVFMRLPHPDDARFASELLGKQFTFVVSGFSLTEGETKEWSESVGSSRSTDVSTSLTRGHSTGSGWLPSVNRSRTTSRSIGEAISRNLTSGGSTSTQRATSWSRTQEYVIEPAVFQQLEPGFMFVVQRGTVTLTEFDPALARLKTTDF